MEDPSLKELETEAKIAAQLEREDREAALEGLAEAVREGLEQRIKGQWATDERLAAEHGPEPEREGDA